MKAILFDLDGVLIDSFYSWWVAFNEALEKFGKKRVGEEEFRERYWGPDIATNMSKFGLGGDAVEYCQDRHMAHIEDIKIFPGAKEVLKSLAKKVKLGLVTNTPAKDVFKTLEHFDLRDCFDVIVTGDDVKKGKPDPEIVVKACKSLGLDPSEVMLVGDTKSDVLAGRSAGCTVVGLGVDGDLRIEKLSDLLKFVE